MITYTYTEQQLVDSRHQEKDNHRHLVCSVRFDGIQFIFLGLELGQKELTTKQKSWLESHNAEIQLALKRRRQFQEGIYIDWENMTKEQKEIVQKPLKLIDQFCRDCKIKDS